jgi:hypothetical protein
MEEEFLTVESLKNNFVAIRDPSELLVIKTAPSPNDIPPRYFSTKLLNWRNPKNSPSPKNIVLHRRVSYYELPFIHLSYTIKLRNLINEVPNDFSVRKFSWKRLWLGNHTQM